jgi:hypothetical protein
MFKTGLGRIGNSSNLLLIAYSNIFTELGTGMVKPEILCFVLLSKMLKHPT